MVHPDEASSPSSGLQPSDCLKFNILIFHFNVEDIKFGVTFDVVYLCNRRRSEETSSGFIGTTQIKVFDITGNLLLNASGNESAINESLNELAINLPKGVYLLRLDSGDGNYSVNKKLIKM